MWVLKIQQSFLHPEYEQFDEAVHLLFVVSVHTGGEHRQKSNGPRTGDLRDQVRRLPFN